MSLQWRHDHNITSKKPVGIVPYHHGSGLPTTVRMLDSSSPLWLSCVVGFCSKVLASWRSLRKSLIPPGFFLLRAAQGRRMGWWGVSRAAHSRRPPSLCAGSPRREHSGSRQVPASPVQRVCLGHLLIRMKWGRPTTDLQTIKHSGRHVPDSGISPATHPSLKEQIPIKTEDIRPLPRTVVPPSVSEGMG